MRAEVKALALHRLARARQAFAEGEQLLATGGVMGATNRFYYAAFYAARTLLGTRHADSSKPGGVISLFQKHFVKTSLVEVDTARTLARAFEKRQKTDYGDFATVTAEEVREIRSEVQVFVEECTRVLDRLVVESDA
ncbi:MAG: HEPN domain-containing protein [Candidatus Rokuibacteriota bacterium]